MDEGKFTLKILKINKSAQDLIRDSSVCRSHFIQWRNQRVETNQVIDDFQKKVEKIHLASNAAKGTGAAVSIVGGLASLTGIALTLTGHGTASKWLQNGNIARVIGIITTTSASLAEFGLTRKIENDIKRILVKDMELMKMIDEWIQRSVVLNSLALEIFGYGIGSKFLIDVLKVCLETVRLVNAASFTWDEITATVEKQLMCSNVSELPEKIFEIAFNIAKRISENRRLIEPVRNICDILMNNHTLREMSLLGLKLHFLMQSMFNSNLILNILTTFGLPFAPFGSVTSRATCDIVGIAFNAVSVIFAAENIRKGSEYSQKLKDLRYLLKKELDDFDSEFKQICN